MIVLMAIYGALQAPFPLPPLTGFNCGLRKNVKTYLSAFSVAVGGSSVDGVFQKDHLGEMTDPLQHIIVRSKES